MSVANECEGWLNECMTIVMGMGDFKIVEKELGRREYSEAPEPGTSSIYPQSHRNHWMTPERCGNGETRL